MKQRLWPVLLPCGVVLKRVVKRSYKIFRDTCIRNPEPSTCNIHCFLAVSGLVSNDGNTASISIACVPLSSATDIILVPAMAFEICDPAEVMVK